MVPNNIKEIVERLNGGLDLPINNYEHTQEGNILLVAGPKCPSDLSLGFVSMVEPLKLGETLLDIKPGETRGHQIYGSKMLQRAIDVDSLGHDGAEFIFKNQDKLIPKTVEDELAFPRTLWLKPDKITVVVTILRKQMKIVLSQEELEHFKRMFPKKEIVKDEERRWFLDCRPFGEVWNEYTKFVINVSSS